MKYVEIEKLNFRLPDDFDGDISDIFDLIAQYAREKNPKLNDFPIIPRSVADNIMRGEDFLNKNPDKKFYAINFKIKNV